MTRGWLYKHGEESAIFEGAAYDAAVADGWVDSPKKVTKPAVGAMSPHTIVKAPKPRDLPDDIDALREILDAGGIFYDRRWGVDRLKEAVRSA